MSSICRLIRHGRGRDELTMPLLRYFLFVGGSLLALLLVANAALPAVPTDGGLTSGTDLPPIRIHSERKLPDRVVFDTSIATPAQASAAPVVIAEAKPRAEAPVQPAMAEMSARERVREAFAQLPPAEDSSEPRMSDMATVVVPEPKIYTARQPARRKVAARPRSGHPMMIVAQQPTPPTRWLFTR
jgi:hypothetical protein